MRAPDVVVYETRAALADGLADRLADRLRALVVGRGLARLAVPGGSTPGPMLTRLAAIALPWRAVVVTLTDERQVPAWSPRANRRMVAATLMQGDAAAARLLTLYAGEDGGGLDAVAAGLEEAVLPLDVAVLGMGADMHTASLFPGAPGLDMALAPGAPAVVATAVPGSGEPRVSLSARVLAAAGERHILIAGPDKRAALDRALAIGDPRAAPVLAVLDGATVHYAD